MARPVLATLIAIALWLPASARADGVAAGDRAPELTNVATTQGRRIKLKAYRNKVVVMTFGASWCKPCKKELPAYDRLAKRYKDAGKTDVLFLAVNIDRERANADKFIRETKVAHLTVGLDPQGAAVDAYDPGTMPTTYFIDRRGIVRHVHPGFEAGDEKKVAAKVDELLIQK